MRFCGSVRVGTSIGSPSTGHSHAHVLLPLQVVSSYISMAVEPEGRGMFAGMSCTQTHVHVCMRACAHARVNDATHCNFWLKEGNR